MKLSKIIYILLPFILLFTNSCTKDEKDDPTEKSHFLKAKVDGVQYNANSIALIAQIDDYAGSKLLTMGGTNGTSGQISIRVDKYTGVGKYKTTTTESNKSILGFSTLQGFWRADLKSYKQGHPVGNIEITKDDGSDIEGTFSFTAYNPQKATTKSITEGKFRIKL